MIHVAKTFNVLAAVCNHTNAEALRLLQRSAGRTWCVRPVARRGHRGVTGQGNNGVENRYSALRCAEAVLYRGRQTPQLAPAPEPAPRRVPFAAAAGLEQATFCLEF